VVVRPTPDARVESGDEGSLVTATVGVDEFLHLFQVPLLSLEAGLDDNLIAPFATMLAGFKLPDREAEKVKTRIAFVFVERVSDAGFAGLEGQPHFGQPFFG